MNIQNKLKALKDQKSYSIPSKRVMEHLKPILSKSNDLRKRWIWELLQNASDLGNSIKARFEITKDKMIFSHNGKPFSLNEAYNLIMPDSTKDDESTRTKSIIGQFGTGFISTHVLSAVIKVSGIIEEEQQLYSFSYHLDRSERNDKEFLIESIKKSEIEYKGSLKEISELPKNEFRTSFTYNIKNTYSPLKGEKIVDDGIDSFKELIPFVLTFRPQLAEIEIVDRRTSLTQLIFRREEMESNIDNLLIVKTVFLKNGKHIEDKLIGELVHEETKIAFPLEIIEKDVFRILPISESCPRIFCAFPMIGTNEFNFPVIMHSEKFIPNRERDGIEITNFDKENRSRLIEAREALRRLLEIVQDKEWTDAFNICRISKPEIRDIDTKNWFLKEVFNPLKDCIYNAKIVELDRTWNLNEYRASLSSVYIPYADKRIKDKEKIVTRIFDFAIEIIVGGIPCRDHYLKWYEVLDFEIFEDKKLDIRKLCEIGAPKANLTESAASICLTNAETMEYFIGLVKFVIEQGEAELLTKYNLVLNQCDVFTTIKGLKLDRITHKGLKKSYGELLKSIYFSLSGNDCRGSLLHKKFEFIKDLLDENDKYELKELAKNIDEAIRNSESNFQDDKFLKILKDIFNWHTTCGLSEDTVANLFPFFSLNKSQLYLNTKTPEELEHAFDIEISGKSKALAKLAKSNISEERLEIIAQNSGSVDSFIEWLHNKQQDSPNEELGNIGEEFLFHQLCTVFGKDRVLWEGKPEYDFIILEEDRKTIKYYVDAKTTAKGIANSENVPFYMRIAQWRFLDQQQATNKYIIARVFRDNGRIDVKYLKLNKEIL